MEQFKKAEFLEVGKVYADISSGKEWTTYLKFVGGDLDKPNYPLFEYVSGFDQYLRNDNGLIRFPSRIQEVSPGVYSYESSPWYIPTEDFLKSINCTKL